MSDGLIERLEKKLRGESDLVILKNELVEILSALKTVRGIESLKESLYQIEYAGQWMVTTPVGIFVGSTLSLAVEAAVGASEKGVEW